MRVFLLIFFIWFNASLANASECGCDPNADLNIRQFIDADLVFKGHVVTKRTEFFPELGYRYVATFFIDELISGNPESSTVDIEFGYGDDFCSTNFHPLFSYLILATKTENFPYFQTHYCSGNKRWENLSRRELRLLFDFQQGKWEEEWRNQFHRVYAKGRLSQRRPNGPWQFFVYDGHLSESGIYLNGKKEGDWYTFYHQFTVCYELNLPPVGRNCDLSQVIAPHPAGWLSSVTPYKNGKIHGAVFTYKASGCIETEAYYEDGKLMGPISKY